MDNHNEWPISEASWSKFWTHRNLGLFDHLPETVLVGTNPQDILRDWNRLVESDKCSYYLNGTQLSVLRNYEKFQTVAELQSFLREHLCQSYPEMMQKQIVALILALGYQSGLFHATSSAVAQMTIEKSNGDVIMARPKAKISLISEKDGIKVIEENIYDVYALKRKEQRCSNTEDYFVKTDTLYRISPAKIELCDLLVTCPSADLAPLFDARPADQQIMRFPILREYIAAIIAAIYKIAGFSLDEPNSDVKQIWPQNRG